MPLHKVIRRKVLINSFILHILFTLCFTLIFRFEFKLYYFLLLSFILLADGFILSLYLKKHYSKIIDIVENVDNLTSNDLAETNINEIDELLKKYNNLKKDFIYDFFNIYSTDKTILGIFRIESNQNLAIVNKSIVGLLQLNSFKEEDHIAFIECSSVKDLVKNLSQFSINEDTDTYFINYSKEIKWVKVISFETDAASIGFVLNITDNMFKSKTLTTYNEKILPMDIFKTTLESKINNSHNRFCIVNFELDFLKIINNTYGHKIGDMYIEIAENKLAEIFDNSIFGKVSGYEFIMCIEASKSESKAKMLERLEWLFCKLNTSTFTAPDKKELSFKTTVGCCFCPDHSAVFDELMRFAAFALYEARHLYLGNIHEFSLETYNRNLYIENKVFVFYNLIDYNKLDYAFQPIVSLRDGKVFGYEAFMRPKTDTLSSPKEVLEIAKAENMLYTIEKMTLFNSYEIIRNNFYILKDKRFFINTICDQLLSSYDLAKLEKEYEAYKYVLVPEVSEDLEWESEISIYKKAAFIKDNASKLAIDCSTGRFLDADSIQNLKPNYIKFDHSMIVDINEKKEYQSLILKTTKLAKKSGILTIAVGVETKSELETLIKLGVDFAQGYYFSLPKKKFVEELPSEIVQQIIMLNDR